MILKINNNKTKMFKSIIKENQRTITMWEVITYPPLILIAGFWFCMRGGVYLESKHAAREQELEVEKEKVRVLQAKIGQIKEENPNIPIKLKSPLNQEEIFGLSTSEELSDITYSIIMLYPYVTTASLILVWFITILDTGNQFDKKMEKINEIIKREEERKD